MIVAEQDSLQNEALAATEAEDFALREELNRAVDDEGNTVLHYRASSGIDAEVSHLCAQGANPNAANDINSTPLHCAALGGHVAVAKVLAQFGARPHVKDNDGCVNRILVFGRFSYLPLSFSSLADTVPCTMQRGRDTWIWSSFYSPK